MRTGLQNFRYTRRIIQICSSVLMVLLLGCNPPKTDLSGVSSSDVVSSPTVAQDQYFLQIYGTSVKTGFVSTTFSNPLQVQLTHNGVAKANEAISFSITSGTGASLSSATVTTDASGLAQVYFTAGATPQTYEVTANWATGSKTVGFALISALSTSASTAKVVRIVQAGVGDQPEIGTETIDLNSGSLNVKAALYDYNTNTYLADVAVTWAAVGGGFNSNDFTGATVNAVTAVFRPTRAGSTVIQASYVGNDANVIGVTDISGSILVTQTLVPNIIQRISGNNQTQVVNDVLTNPIKVRILTSTGVPIPGLGVDFSAGLGGGTVVTAQPVVTDADGYASSTVQFATVPGTYGFTATVVADNTITIGFTATATVGTPHHLAFSTQPAGANAGNPFTQQPVVLVKDAFNNTVTSVPTSVSIGIGNGSGVLSGTLTKTSASGIVSFTDLSYNILDTGVTLVASASGLASTTSSSFNVNAFLGACALNDGMWNSTQGGCKDLASGIIWSQPTTISYSWYESVWDSVLGSAKDVGDYGRSNDYEAGVGCVGNCDNSTVDYCHDLSYNGYSDWRLPSASELSTAYTNGASSHLYDIPNSNVWSSSTASTSTSAETVNLTTGVRTSVAKSTLLKTYCVRGGWSNPARISIVKASNWIRIGKRKQSVEVALQDGAGTAVNGSGVTISLATNTGTMSGTLTATTNNIGRAVLDDWEIDTASSQILTASSSGLLSANQNVTGKTVLAHECAIEDSRFTTADGGCKDLASGLVWSKRTTAGMGWADAVWSSTLSGNAPSDSNDYGKLNDYIQGTVPGNPDSSITNYCHDLAESGQSDWRLPTFAELMQIGGSGRAGNHFNFDTTGYFWSADTNIGDNRQAFLVRLSDAALSSDYKWNGYPVLCVRDAGKLSTYNAHACSTSNGVFASGNGGCQDLGSGLVWSYGSFASMGWGHAVWSSTYTGNAPSDIYDFGLANDYTNGAVPGNPDTDLTNYCHDLVEGGYRDWRMPSYSEMLQVGGSTKAGSYFTTPTSSYFWTSQTNAGDTRQAIVVRLSDDSPASNYKTIGYQAICVRTVPSN